MESDNSYTQVTGGLFGGASLITHSIEAAALGRKTTKDKRWVWELQHNKHTHLHYGTTISKLTIGKSDYILTRHTTHISPLASQH